MLGVPSCCHHCARLYWKDNGGAHVITARTDNGKQLNHLLSALPLAVPLKARLNDQNDSIIYQTPVFAKVTGAGVATVYTGFSVPLRFLYPSGAFDHIMLVLNNICVFFGL